MKKSIIISFLPATLLVNSGFAQQKPNIVYFLMDDLGYAEIGAYGQKKIETPNIDALALAGKSFMQHYSGSPVSAPSRCVLMTGKHTGHAVVRGNDEAGKRGNVWSHQAMFDNPGLEGQAPMPENTRTLAHQLKDAGYTTGCIGKWGLGYPGSVSEPNKMGFDFFYGYNCQRMAHTYYPPFLWKNNQRENLNNKVMQPDTRLPEGADPLNPASYESFRQNDYAPDLMFAETLNFIESNKNKPFFLWWTTPLPHASLQAPQQNIDYYLSKFGHDEPPFLGGSYYPVRYPHATYAAMVKTIDDQIGAIVAKLKELNLYDNTIIVFTSDNGPTFNGGTDSPWFDSAHPFRSDRGWGKTSLREGGIRVPTIVVWKGKVPANTHSDMISGFQDWLPTLTQLAGAKSLKDSDGISLVNEMLETGKQKQHKYLYWEFPEGSGQLAVRWGKWKFYVQDVKTTPKYMLYDLSIDPTETTNVIANNTAVVTTIKQFVLREHQKPENSNFVMPIKEVMSNNF